MVAYIALLYQVILIVFMCCIELSGLFIYHLQMVKSGYGDQIKGYCINNEGIYNDYDDECKITNDNGSMTMGLMRKGIL